MHDAIGVIGSAFACLELRVTVPVFSEGFRIVSQPQIPPHLCNVNIRPDVLPEVGALVLVP